MRDWLIRGHVAKRVTCSSSPPVTLLSNWDDLRVAVLLTTWLFPTLSWVGGELKVEGVEGEEGIRRIGFSKEIMLLYSGYLFFPLYIYLSSLLWHNS